MTLIAIVLALVLERVLSYAPAWRAHDLTGRWMNWVDERVGRGSWSLVAYLLAPVCLVAGLEYSLLQQPGGVILSLPLALLVLLACLGPRDLAEQVSAYRHAQKSGDTAVQESILQDLIAGPNRREGEIVDRSPVAACFVQGHERWFAVLLWFFVLGAAGAVAYRVLAAVTYHLREDGNAQDSLRLAESLHGAMAWPSARVAAIFYALGGSTDHALACWRRWSAEYQGSWIRDPWPLLAHVGLAALARDPDEAETEPEGLEAALQLLERSLLILLAVLALFTLGGWVA